MRKFTESGYNNADKTVCRFMQRAFEICNLFRHTGLKAFMPYVLFTEFYVDKVSNGTVYVHFNLTDGWAYVKFPVEVMNLDDDAVLEKFEVVRIDPVNGNELDYEIAERKSK